MDPVGVEPPHNKWVIKFLGDRSGSYVEDKMAVADSGAVILAHIVHGSVGMSRAIEVLRISL